MKKITLLFIIGSLLMTYLIQAQDGYMGVHFTSLHETKAEKLNLPEAGMYITTVKQNSPAAMSGLELFDYVYKIDDEEINESDMSLHEILDQYNVGDKAVFSVIRDGKKKKVKMLFGNEDDYDNYHRSSAENPMLGVEQKHWKSETGVGVKVEVNKNTTADRIGMKDNDIIVAIDGDIMIDWHDIGNAIDNRSVGDDIEVTILRGKEELVFEGPIGSHHGDIAIVENIQDMEVKVEDMPAEEKQEIKKETGVDMPLVSNLKVEDLTVFPNPNVGLFNVQFELAEFGDVEISVFDAQGKRIKYRNLVGFQGQFNERFDLGAQPSGNYFLMLKQGERVMTRK
ncbi:MAG: PDZ domain-containing protein, partial [Bacteroidota bacterium]